MELCAPFEGWTMDDEGTIHTLCGYRCTPQQIEAALWMVGFLRFDRGARVIFADTPMVEPRKMWDIRDLEFPPADAIRIRAKAVRQVAAGSCLSCGKSRALKGAAKSGR